MNYSNNNKRIAVNTLFLYIRMLFTMAISLYTSRVILKVLGADDFGIYNVVGGVVVLFSFLTNAMTSSTQRFLNYNLGLNDRTKISNVFNTAIQTHLTILFIVLFCSETIGLWFVQTHLNIPSERMLAANWVYQMSIIATLINIIVIPFRASIIAAERMSIFAIASIIEVSLKLISVSVLVYISQDKLIAYSISIVCVSLITFFIYKVQCNKKLTFTKLRFHWDKRQYTEMLSFSGWYFLGGMANVASNQGINIIINIFFSVGVNAAVGIANQVKTAVLTFTSSFQTAFNPQIVKMYAVKDINRLIVLLFRSSKFSYFLLIIILFPIIFFCDEILALWLYDVPQYAVIFTQLVVISAILDVLSSPLMTAVGATGKVKNYQIGVSMIIMADLPLTYIAFKGGLSPTYAFIIKLIVSIFVYIFRLYYVRKYIKFDITDYLRKVIQPCIMVSLLSLPIPLFLQEMSTSIMSTISLIVLNEIIVCLLIIFVGLDNDERVFFKQSSIKITKKLLRK